MAEKTTAVSESLELFAALGIAFVGTIMLVHVFAVSKVSNLWFQVIMLGCGEQNLPPFALAIK